MTQTDRPLKILFTSLSCLVDPASGAAISVRTILQYLGERGHDVSALSSGCFDKSQFDTAGQMLRWVGFQPTDDPARWTMADDTMTHEAVEIGSHAIKGLPAEAIDKAIAAFMTRIDRDPPDIMITYGSTRYEKSVRQLAADRGIAQVFYLAHPSYKNAEDFDPVDLVVVDSEATAALYAERLGLETTVIGKFIRRPRARRPGPDQRHITFVNPTANKGVTLFYRIAEMMASTLPSARFLVVESRARLAHTERLNGIPFSRMRNLRAIGLQADMGEVFSRTHVLLMPSLWHESGGRVAIEALSLGIPVVSSNHGGLAEHMGDGAIRIDVPEPLKKQNFLIPPPSVAIPWVAALGQLWSDPEYWRERSAAALTRWAHHDPKARVDLIEAKFRELAGERP